MTALAGVTGISEDTIGHSSARILSFMAQSHPPVAHWWVELAGLLDELRQRMNTQHLDASGHRELREQIRRDAPHMFFRIRRLENEAEALEDEMMRVRLIVGDAAGDPRAAGRVGLAVDALLMQVQQHERNVREVLLDAYEQDLGGG